MTKKYKYFFIILIIYSLNLCSCRIYSFTGATYEGAETYSVQYFPNRASYVYPALSQDFTEGLIERFDAQTPLDRVDKKGDIRFEGEIVDYKTETVGVTSNEVAASNRLTIVIRVKFENIKSPKLNFDKRFSAKYDYDSNLSLADIESEATAEIIELIINDIFIASVDNW